jgi:hypothetical protein
MASAIAVDEIAPLLSDTEDASASAAALGAAAAHALAGIGETAVDLPPCEDEKIEEFGRSMFKDTTGMNLPLTVLRAVGDCGRYSVLSGAVTAKADDRSARLLDAQGVAEHITPELLKDFLQQHQKRVDDLKARREKGDLQGPQHSKRYFDLLSCLTRFKTSMYNKLKRRECRDGDALRRTCPFVYPHRDRPTVCVQVSTRTILQRSCWRTLRQRRRLHLSGSGPAQSRLQLKRRVLAKASIPGPTCML